MQTLADKRAEATALDKFQTYEKDGGLLKYFVDHTLLADWLDAFAAAACRRLATCSIPRASCRS